jgi:hypothetical protein
MIGSELVGPIKLPGRALYDDGQMILGPYDFRDHGIADGITELAN